MAPLNVAFAAFFSTMQSTGIMNNVTLFTESEFNRTGNSMLQIFPNLSNFNPQKLGFL
jgi:hypothetical protein